MNAPNKFYYEALANRIPNHGQSIAELESRGILLDGQNNNGSPILLLQIFSKPVMGPAFFEFIQRNGYIEQYQNKNGTI